MQITIKRRGGLAGVGLHADVDTADLGAESAKRVEAAVGRLLDARPTRGTSHPDEFSYEISVPGHDEPVRLAETEMPDDLEPLVAELSRAGRVEPHRRRH